MKSLRLNAIGNALESGCGALHDPDHLYHSPQWLTRDEEVGIARPFSVVCLPDNGPPAVAAAWGLIVDDAAFWPFMRIDTVLSNLLEKRKVPQTSSTKKTLRSLMPNAYLGALRGGTTRLRVDPALPAGVARRAPGEGLDGVGTMARGEGPPTLAGPYVPAAERPLRGVHPRTAYVEV